MEENFASLKKYNFWEGNVPELGYYCKDYTDKILSADGNILWIRISSFEWCLYHKCTYGSRGSRISL